MAYGTYTISFSSISGTVSGSYIKMAHHIILNGVSTSGSVPSNVTITKATLRINSLTVYTKYPTWFMLKDGNDSVMLADASEDNGVKYNDNASTGTTLSPLTFDFPVDQISSSIFNVSSSSLHLHFDNTGSGPSVNVFKNPQGSSSSAGTITITYSYDDGGGGGGGSSKTKSTITTCPSSVTIGSNFTVGISGGYVTSLNHKLKYAFGSQSTTVSMSGTTHTWAFPDSWGSVIASQTEGTATITLYSYDGSTLIGSDSATITVNTNGRNPSVSLSLSKNTTSPINAYIQNLTTVTVTANASASPGASISSYVFTCGSLSSTLTTNVATFVVPAGSGDTYSLPFTCTVTDSRGKTASTSTSQTAYSYSSPDVTNRRVIRCNASGVASDTGTYISITCDPTKSVVGNQNTGTFSVYFRNDTSSEWTLIESISLSGATKTYSYTKLYNATLDTSSSYSVRFVIEDLLNQRTEIIMPVTSSTYIMFFKKGGDAIGIGTTVGDSDALTFKIDSQWKVKHGDNYIPTMIVQNNEPSADPGVIWLKPVR